MPAPAIIQPLEHVAAAITKPCLTSSRIRADQLDAKPSLTADIYIGRKKRARPGRRRC